MMETTREKESKRVTFPTVNVIASGVASGLAAAAVVGLSPLIPLLAVAGGVAGFVLTNKIPQE